MLKFAQRVNSMKGFRSKSNAEYYKENPVSSLLRAVLPAPGCFRWREYAK